MDHEGDFGDDRMARSNTQMNYSSWFTQFERDPNTRQGNVPQDVKGFNPGLIVLLLVGGLVLAFLIGNYFLYMYAQKTLPAKKKKPVSKKKMKKERLKQGVSAPGE